MHIVGRSPQKANESALECNAQLTVHNGLLYEILSEIKNRDVTAGEFLIFGAASAMQGQNLPTWFE